MSSTSSSTPPPHTDHIGLTFLKIFMFISLSAMVIKSFQKKRHKRDFCFFHPYCNNGGGGERVLWVMIHEMLKAQDGRPSFVDEHDLCIVIYNGNTNVSKDEILDNVDKKFQIQFTDAQKEHIEIVNILSTTLLEAKWYPVATMIGQSLGSIIVVLECLIRRVPDFYCDTIGAPFAFPVVRLFTSKVFAYVHYPVISSDMLKKVREQRPSFNNNERIAQNVTVSSLKLLYYRIFAAMFTFIGFFVDLVVANSSWTRNHIEQLWRLSDSPVNQQRPKSTQVAKDSSKTIESMLTRKPRRLVTIYPPCNTAALQTIALRRSPVFRLRSFSQHPLLAQQTSPALSIDLADLEDKLVVISIGQFRPEKDHHLQIRIMEEIKKRNSERTEDKKKKIVLLMFGSCRNREDEVYVSELQQQIDRLQLADYVRIHTNQPYQVLLFFLAAAQVGLHTMWNEHFGISIVEMMAAGLLTIAHNSGGPKADIVDPGQTGFLAERVEEYADIIEEIAEKYEENNGEWAGAIQRRAREKAQTFSDELFGEKILAELGPAL